MSNSTNNSRKVTPLSSTSTSPSISRKERNFPKVSLSEPPICRVKRIEHYIKFPLLCAEYVSKTNTIIVAGGGGPGHHGIGNGMKCLKVNQDADALYLENSFDSADSVMSLAMHPKDLIVVLAVGKDIMILNINGQKIATLKTWKGPLNVSDPSDYQKVTCFSSGGKLVFSASSSGIITSWRYPAFSQIDQVRFSASSSVAGNEDFVSFSINRNDSLICMIGELQCILLGLGPDGKFQPEPLFTLDLSNTKSNTTASSSNKTLRVRSAVFGRGSELKEDLLYILVNETLTQKGSRKVSKTAKVLVYHHISSVGGWKLVTKVEVSNRLHASCLAQSLDGNMLALGSKSGGQIWLVKILSREALTKQSSSKGPLVTLKRLSKKMRTKDVAVTGLSFDSSGKTIIVTLLSGQMYLFAVPQPFSWKRFLIVSLILGLVCLIVALFGLRSGSLVGGIRNIGSTLMYPFEAVVEEAPIIEPFQRPEYYEDEDVQEDEIKQEL